MFYIATFYFGIGLYFAKLYIENAFLMSTLLNYDEIFNKNITDKEKEMVIKLIPYFILFFWPLSAFSNKKIKK